MSQEEQPNQDTKDISSAPIVDSLPDSSLVGALETPAQRATAESLANLLEMLKSPVVRDRLHQALKSVEIGEGGKVRQRNMGPYYKSSNALQLKAVLDEMLADNTDRIIRYSFYPHLSKKSLYLKIDQGLRYLCNELDPDLVYTNLKRKMDLYIGKNGIELNLHANKKGPEIAPLMSDKLVEKDKRADWKIKVDEWLETPWTPELTKEQCILNIPDVNLDDQEQTELRESLSCLAGVSFAVKANHIRVIKHDPNL